MCRVQPGLFRGHASVKFRQGDKEQATGCQCLDRCRGRAAKLRVEVRTGEIAREAKGFIVFFAIAFFGEFPEDAIRHKAKIIRDGVLEEEELMTGESFFDRNVL